MHKRLLGMVRAHPTLLAIYLVAGAQAFVYQAFIRLQQCMGAEECSITLAKGFVWSVIWPVYWLGHFLLF